MEANIAVIIPAYRAEWCIANAVTSALAQPEVAEVLVVDDASGDNTLDVAASADDGTGRLKLLRQKSNQGPAAARNRAIAESTAPIIALLDSDDQFLPGRFAALQSVEEPWDLLADDILFTADTETIRRQPQPCASQRPHTRRVGLAEFVRKNISQRGADRSEMGFLKPLMKRDFLERHSLAYHEELRLGEDFILYAEALAKGAVFLIADLCGYGAIERAGSLSGNHSEKDLAALAARSRGIMEALPEGAARASFADHVTSLERKVAHRHFLDLKRGRGLGSALAWLAGQPAQFPHVALSIAQDKIAPVDPLPLPRKLFSREEFEIA